MTLRNVWRRTEADVAAGWVRAGGKHAVGPSKLLGKISSGRGGPLDLVVGLVLLGIALSLAAWRASDG